MYSHCTCVQEQSPKRFWLRTRGRKKKKPPAATNPRPGDVAAQSPTAEEHSHSSEAAESPSTADAAEHQVSPSKRPSADRNIDAQIQTGFMIVASDMACFDGSSYST